MTQDSPRPFLDRLPWYLVAVVLVVLSVLIGASVANYVSVAQVHVDTSLYATDSVAYASDGGSVGFTLHLAVDNPSSRILLFDTVGYKVWIEDLPVEAGVAGHRSGDIAGPNGTTYFPVFMGSIQVPPAPVPAAANVTYLYTLNLTAGNDPYAFGVVSNITAYAKAHLGGPAAVPWIFWTSVVLDIDGVPPPAAYSPADYLLNLGRVSLEGGQDLGGGLSLGP